MNPQAKRPLAGGSGKRAECDLCFGLAKKTNVTCERCNSKGTILYPLRLLIDRLAA